MARSTLILTLFLLAACEYVSAQIPQIINVQLYLEESGVPVTGQRSLEVSWFTIAVGGTPLHSEVLTADVADGVATVFLGSTIPLPQNLLLNGPFWLGLRIDGGPELQPRTMLASVPYAMLADRARIAQALAPEVTGVVTSVNEISGTVQIVGVSGVDVQRNGSTLEISTSTPAETGQIEDRSGEYLFDVAPLTTLLPGVSITARVLSDSHIGVRVSTIDYINNRFQLATTAPLRSDEVVVWSIQP